jgi:hypothetical protein
MGLLIPSMVLQLTYNWYFGQRQMLKSWNFLERNIQRLIDISLLKPTPKPTGFVSTTPHHF